MKQAVISGCAVLLLVVITEAHYLPSQHWRPAIHRPSIHQIAPYHGIRRMNTRHAYPAHGINAGHAYPMHGMNAGHAYPMHGMNAGHAYPMHRMNAGHAYPMHGMNAGHAYPMHGMSAGHAAPEARPAFPAPESITGPQDDQMLDILASTLLLGSGDSIGRLTGVLGLARAF